MDTCLAALQLMVYYRNLPTFEKKRRSCSFTDGSARDKERWHPSYLVAETLIKVKSAICLAFYVKERMSVPCFAGHCDINNQRSNTLSIG